jgi:predicted aldo/keto reductase-like oxidoreductase
MYFKEKVILGRTNLTVGRIGLSSSFGAPSVAFEEAFDRGCNYFSWGTVLKGRSPEMRKAIQQIITKGQRGQLVVSMITYAHNAFLTEKFLLKNLKEAKLTFADILVLGYFNKRPRQALIDGAMKLKNNGIVKFLGLTTHNRKLIPELEKEKIFDVYHVRYSAAHRGAELDVFPFLTEPKPGIVSFTATGWRQLLNPRKMPHGENPATAVDCYRFVLSNPFVNVCMMGTRNLEQMRENLRILDMAPMNEGELDRMKIIGDHVRGRKS